MMSQTPPPLRPSICITAGRPSKSSWSAMTRQVSREALGLELATMRPPGRALPVVVVCGQAHENLSIINQQAVHAVGDAPGLIDVIVYNLGLIGDRIYFHQGSCGVAHTGEVQLPLELEGHPVAGEIVFHCHGGGIAREDVGMLAPDVPLPENHLGPRR